MQTSIQEFTLSLLAYKGALVEPGDRSAAALLGTELASFLGMNEYQRLVFDPSVDEPGAVRVDYDAASFEALGKIVDSFGTLACLRLAAPELKALDPERELERSLRLQNGVYRLQDFAVVETLYLGFFLQYDVMADERSGGVAEVWVNPAARSLAGLATLLETPHAGDTPVYPVADLLKPAWDLALPAAASLVESRLDSFRESLKRRRERDLHRMADYYRAIDEEIRRKITRAASKEEARNSEISRLKATILAYQSRAADVIERYRMRVRIARIAALACTIPAYQLRVHLLRRTRKAEAVFSWNPFDRRIERKCCDACRRATESAALCDDQVHYLCLDCLAPCAVCSRVFCRACHRRCPRAHAITGST
jgi:hypothetical protein